MLAKYEAPAVTMYGAIDALTNSAKCTPGGDNVYDSRDATIFVTPSTPTYADGAQMQWLDGSLVDSGTKCINLFDGSKFITN